WVTLSRAGTRSGRSLAHEADESAASVACREAREDEHPSSRRREGGRRGASPRSRRHGGGGTATGGGRRLPSASALSQSKSRRTRGFLVEPSPFPGSASRPRSPLLGTH